MLVLFRLRTLFHRQLATREWKRTARSFIEREIGSALGSTSGLSAAAVSSNYNDERYMGPLSAVRCKFEVEAIVVRPRSFRFEVDTSAHFVDTESRLVRPRRRLGVIDYLSLTVRYHQPDGRFSVVRAEVSTAERRAALCAARRDLDAFAAKALAAHTLGDLKSCLCRYCGTPFELCFHPRGDLASVTCSGCGIYTYHQVGERRPADWQSYACNDWLDNA